jgi:hypothetical protein
MPIMPMTIAKRESPSLSLNPNLGRVRLRRFSRLSPRIFYHRIFYLFTSFIYQLMLNIKLYAQ